MKTVLITGAEGNIGTGLRRNLAGRYTLRSLTRDRVEGLESTVADVADLDALMPAFAGVAAVIHLAASATVDAAWKDVLHNNIEGLYNVLEASRLSGVGQVVFASSNHAIGGYEADGAPEIYRRGSGVMVGVEAPLRPDSLYGVSKAFGEAMGRYFVEKFGLKVYCLRIGSVLTDDDPRSREITEEPGPFWLPPMTAEQRLRRYAATWLSHADLARLVDACLRAEHISFGIYYGVSDNPYRFWTLDNARADLGYWPEDAASAAGPD